MNINRRRGVHAASPLLLGLVLAVLPTGAARPQAAVAPAARPAPDLPLEEARAAFDALPEAERRSLQDALVWTGDYNGLVDGSFGRQTYDSIAAYQQRVRQTPSGFLDPRGRAALKAAAQQARDAAGFTLVDDPRSGVRIGVPERFLPKKDANANGGTRWQSADDKVTLDTRSLPEPNGGLQGLYDRNLAVQTPGRQITYKVIRPDFFVIAGETPTGKFYTRYASGPGGLRGFSIGYDKALAREVDRFVVAIANSFVPFPASAPPAAVAVPAEVKPVVAPVAVAAPTPPAEARPNPSPGGGLVGTGLIIGPNQVATTVGVDTCRELRATGVKPRQARSLQGVTILDFDAALKPAPFAVGGRAEAGTPLVALAYRRQGAQDELVATPAVAEEDGSVSAALQAGGRGAPVFDLSGALRGLVEGRPEQRRVVAGVVPPARYKLVSEGLTGVGRPDVVQGAQPTRRSTGDVAASLRVGIVPITCSP